MRRITEPPRNVDRQDKIWREEVRRELNKFISAFNLDTSNRIICNDTVETNGLRRNIRSVTAATTLLVSDDVLLCDGTFTVSGDAATLAEHYFDVNNTGTGTITGPDGSSILANESITYQSDGTNWRIL